jgi:hypothetical protein
MQRRSDDPIRILQELHARPDQDTMFMCDRYFRTSLQCFHQIYRLRSHADWLGLQSTSATPHKTARAC